MGKNQKTKRSYTRKLGTYFLIAFIVVISVSVGYRKNVLRELSRQTETLEKQLEEAEQENIKLINDEQYYTSDAYIEKVAREQLGLVMPDEVVFKEKE
ncbi:MAG: septum formation initiator family protein [Firmicutes bacterium]|nr:septum formation initiator family protein [Bacillota bacterium]